MEPSRHNTTAEFLVTVPDALSSIEMKKRVKSKDGYVNWEVILHMSPHATRSDGSVLLNLEAVAFSPEYPRPYTKKFVYASLFVKAKRITYLCKNCRQDGYEACQTSRNVGLVQSRCTLRSPEVVESILAQGRWSNNFHFKMTDVPVDSSSLNTVTHSERTWRHLIIEVTLFHLKFDEGASTSPNVPAAASSVTRSLQAMLDSGALSDVSFFVGDEELKAHRVVLGAGSDVFKAMFERDTQDSRTGRISIEGSDAKAFRAMLRCLYTGTMPDWTDEDDDFLMGVLNLAVKYNLVLLREECQRRILCTMSVANVVERLKAVNILSPDMVPLLADPFVRTHFSEILPTEEWAEFMKNDVQLAAQVMYNAMIR